MTSKIVCHKTDRYIDDKQYKYPYNIILNYFSNIHSSYKHRSDHCSFFLINTK